MSISGLFALRCPHPIPRLLLCFRSPAGIEPPFPVPGLSPVRWSVPYAALLWQGNIWISQVPELPLWAHALVSDPGGLPSTRHFAPRTAAFRCIHRVGFPCKQDYPNGPQLYIFRSSIQSLHPWSRPASDFHYWFCPRTSLLTCWLGFGQVGLSLIVITHWVTLTNFIYIYIESQGLGFTLARALTGYVMLIIFFIFYLVRNLIDFK